MPHAFFADRKVTFCVIQGTGAQSFGISFFLEMSEDYFCPGCSAHQLLIYRDPGHLARAEAAGTSENIQDANATPVKAKEKNLESKTVPGTTLNEAGKFGNRKCVAFPILNSELD